MQVVPLDDLPCGIGELLKMLGATGYASVLVAQPTSMYQIT